MSDPVEIRAYRDGDEHGILDSYNRVFPTADGQIGTRGMAHWRWKFADNPSGLIQITVAEHAQHGIVGAYPVLPLRMVIDGQRRIGAQAVDLVVLPAFRRHGERPGLFVSLGRKNQELWGGPGKTEFHYGWAVPAWRIGQRYLGYENIRDWNFLFRETEHGRIPDRAAPKELAVQQVERFGADVDALWARLEPTFRCATVRDAAYLNWRYADAHDFSYRLLECRDGRGRLRGVAVFSVGDFLFPHTAFLVDWLVPLDDVDATVALVAAAERLANVAGAGALATLFNPIDPRSLQFQRLGFLVFGTTYFIGMAPFESRGTVFYRDHWYLTPGDSDLV